MSETHDPDRPRGDERHEILEAFNAERVVEAPGDPATTTDAPDAVASDADAPPPPG